MFHTPKQFFTHALPFMRPRATVDFESRSPANIRNGPWLYARNKHTRILCLSFVLPGQDPLDPSLYAPPMGGYEAFEHYPLDASGRPYDLERLFQYIRDGGLVEAHNVAFEANMWEHVATKPAGYDENGATGLGAPPVKDSQWRCSAAKVASCALPRDLDGAGEAMDLPDHLRKDKAGSKIMLKHSKPRKAKRGEPKVDEDGVPIIYYPAYDREDFLNIYSYCQGDVRSEHALSEVVPDLSEREYQVWLADFRANRKGVLVDRALVEMAIKLEAEYKAELNEVLGWITMSDTNESGIKGTERAKVLDWLDEHGVALPDSTAPTLDHLMASSSFDELSADVQTVVRIARNINKTSVSKFKRILACMDPEDDRVRDLVMYHGAATGRWSGKGIQVQNFPKGDLEALLGLGGSGINENWCSPSAYYPKGHPFGIGDAIADIMTGDLQWLKCLYGDVLALLSSVLRGALIPTPGKVFYVADYSAIEARVVLWLAGATKALEVFLRGEDIYMDMATGIYGYPVTDKKKQKEERAFGKVAVLGLGYGMGWLTFLLTLRSYKIKFTPEKAREIMGDEADKMIGWVEDQLWPEAPEEGADAETVRKYKARLAGAKKNLRRLTDEREIPSKIVAELALCKYTVNAYRKRYPEVPKLWAEQEKAACRAVQLWKKAKAAHEGAWEREKDYALKAAKAGKTYHAVEPEFPEPIPVVAGKVTWVVEGRWLKCYLPSGRPIYYNLPDVKAQKTPWGETRPSLRFMGVHKKSRKWARMSSYGGSIVENIDQGTARDMMADAIVRIDSGYDSETWFEFIASIHDEALTEADDDGVDHYEELEGLMSRLAECYAGCPVDAEGAQLMRYQK